jgi:hypothetical protein
MSLTSDVQLLYCHRIVSASRFAKTLERGLRILSIWYSIFVANGSGIQRPELTRRVTEALRQNPITALIGVRQCGKTTLAWHLAGQQPSEYFNLESPSDSERLAKALAAS